MVLGVPWYDAGDPPPIMAVTAWPLLSDDGSHKVTLGTSSRTGRVLGDYNTKRN